LGDVLGKKIQSCNELRVSVQNDSEFIRVNQNRRITLSDLWQDFARMLVDPLEILKKAGGWIKLSPLDPQPEPVNLLALKADIAQRWPMTSLLDILKETDLRVGFTQAFRSPTAWETLDRNTLQ
jgi:hypothetical protein